MDAGGDIVMQYIDANTQVKYLNPKFVPYTEEYRYVDKDTATAYQKLYKAAKQYANYNNKQFKFGLVVYDEIENFPKDSRNSRFNYPFQNQKTITNEYRIEPETITKHTETFNMKRSTVCLERSPFAGLNIPSKLRSSIKQFL